MTKDEKVDNNNGSAFALNHNLTNLRAFRTQESDSSVEVFDRRNRHDSSELTNQMQIQNLNAINEQSFTTLESKLSNKKEDVNKTRYQDSFMLTLGHSVRQSAVNLDTRTNDDDLQRTESPF